MTSQPDQTSTFEVKVSSQRELFPELPTEQFGQENEHELPYSIEIYLDNFELSDDFGQGRQGSQDNQLNHVLSDLQISSPSSDENSKKPSKLSKLEVDMYLYKLISYLCFMSLTSLLGILIVKGVISYLAVIIVAIIYLIYRFLFDLFWTMGLFQDLWIDNDDVYDMFEAVCGALALLFIALKLSGNFLVCTFAFFPLMVLALIYAEYSNAPRKIKIRRFLAKILYSVQVLCITVKIDQHVNWSLWLVFAPSLLYLSVLIISNIKNLLKDLAQIKFDDTKKLPNPVNKAKTMSLLWYLTHISSPAMFLTILIGFIEFYEDNKNSKLLTAASSISLIVNTILFIWNLVAKNALSEFVQAFGLIESYRVNQNETTNDETLKKIITFQAEKKDTYFVKVSPKCFVELQDGPQNQEDSKADRKYTEMNTKTNLRTIREKCLTENPSMNAKEIEIIERLFTDDCVKETLDEIDQEPPVMKRSRTLEEEDSCCYICNKNSVDAVLMDCGHGGMCYDCTTVSITENEKCMECQNKVEGFYKLDLNSRFFNIIRGYEFNKIIVNTV